MSSSQELQTITIYFPERGIRGRNFPNQPPPLLLLHLLRFMSSITEWTSFRLFAITKPIISCFVHGKFHTLQCKFQMFTFMRSITDRLRFRMSTQTPKIVLIRFQPHFKRFFVINFSIFWLQMTRN